MASIKKSSFLVPSASGYAKAGLRWFGHEPRCTPYWPHSVIWALLYSLPEAAIDSWRFNFCLKIRKRGQLNYLRILGKHSEEEEEEEIFMKFSMIELWLFFRFRLLSVAH